MRVQNPLYSCHGMPKQVIKGLTASQEMVDGLLHPAPQHPTGFPMAEPQIHWMHAMALELSETHTPSVEPT